MQVVITAVGPDNRGLADPIVHHVTNSGANIYEIQMYDHDSERLFAMLLRFDWPNQNSDLSPLRSAMKQIGQVKNLSIRTWSRDEGPRPPRLAICTTYRPEPATAILNSIPSAVLRVSTTISGDGTSASASCAFCSRLCITWRNCVGSPSAVDNGLASFVWIFTAVSAALFSYRHIYKQEGRL